MRDTLTPFVVLLLLSRPWPSACQNEVQLKDLKFAIRKSCSLPCGKEVPDGMVAFIDPLSKCVECTCKAGAFVDCRKQEPCESRETHCLEEDDRCRDMDGQRLGHCPEGTECRETSAGPGTCTRLAANVCTSWNCDKGATCRISGHGNAICRKGCRKTCGGYVAHGWSGYDDGSNHCNRCGCHGGTMICTLMGCTERVCPAECTVYTPIKPCFLTPTSPLDLTIELAKPAIGSLTFRQLCYNPETCTCGFYPRVLCLLNPCDRVSCKEGYHCEPQYCGGCNYVCVKDRCPARVRKAYSTLPCSERKRFVRAVKAYKLANPSEYADFVSMHQMAWNYAHSSQEFLPWHRWYLIGFENALRSMGGEFECITIPYWDWETDAGDEDSSSPLRCDTFGRSSGVDGSNCVNEGISKYPTWTVTGGGCLERTFNGNIGFTGEASLLSYIQNYASYSGFRPVLEGSPHASPHVYIGGQMGTAVSPEDPLFWIHHCNVDRLWALWQDYHGYDEVAKGSYTNTHYYQAANLNNVMPFDKDNFGNVLSYFSNPVTIRDMMHIHDMPQGNSFSYGTDALAFTLGSPLSGSWSWVVPGTARRVWCWALCWKFPVFEKLPVSLFFHNPVFREFEQTFRRETCEKDDADLRASLFSKLALRECEQLGKKRTATDEWMETMWREDKVFFERCVDRKPF